MSLPASNQVSPLHLIGSFDDPYNGADREILDIRALLAEKKTAQLWSVLPPHPYYAGRGICAVQPFAHQFPKGGTLVVSGVHVRLDIWLKYAQLKRVILVYNIASHARLFATIEALRLLTGLEPELVFVSRALQLGVGLPGRVIYTAVDLSAFLAANQSRDAPGADGSGAAPRPMTIGRISRDIPEKHHPDDPALYRMLASRGVRVRIMGGMCMAPQLQGVQGIELLPVGTEVGADFLQTLDVFFYRTGAWFESYARVVVEAMASGLPVVADNRGGHVEIVKHGLSGYLIGSQEEAYDALMALRASPGLRRQMGRAGLEEALRVHGPEAARQSLQGYLD
jgi:glycosyltransferase involved in cell wall biosynthesis